MNCFRKLFIEHPESVGESYLYHGAVALSLSLRLFIFSTAELIHAIVPGVDVFKLANTTSQDEIYKLYLELKERKERK